MGKKKPKQEVTLYGMSIHFGICAGPVDYLRAIFAEEKQAWTGTLFGQAAFIINNPNLFGGNKKEGGLVGRVDWLPGASTQTIPDALATKFGRTATTMPGYRGIASLFFSGAGRDRGFQWRYNTPYLPGIWAKVGRASVALGETHARIWRGGSGSGGDIIIPTGGDSIAAASVLAHRHWSVSISSWGGSLDPGVAEIEFATLGQTKHTPVSASASSEFSAGFAASKAIDGDKFSAWAPSGALPQRLAVDYGSAVAVNVCRILSRNRSSPMTFTVDYSDDGAGWTTAWTVAAGGGGSADSNLPPYPMPGATAGGTPLWRIGILSSVSGTALSIAEAEFRATFYGADLTGSGKPFADGVLNSSFTPEKAFDDNNSTAWHFGGTSPDFDAGALGYEFDDSRSVVQIAIRSRNGFPNDAPMNFKLQSSADGFTWADRMIVTGSTGWANGGETRIFPGEFDSNPSHIIYECLTNENWGMGAPASAIDVASFTACAATLASENFGLSMIWTRSSVIEDFISEVLGHIEATLFVNPRTGLLTLKLIRFDYDIGTLPTFTPDNSVVTNFSRKLWGETINEINVTWTNDMEEEETVTAQDLANIEAQGGVISDGRNYYGVRNASLATRLAHRDLRSASTPLAKCDMEVNREAWALLPGDVCKLNSPEDGVDQLIMRVGPVDYGKPGDSAVRVSLVEDVFSLALADYSEPPESEWIDASEPPSAADFAEIITLPYYVIANGVDPAVADVGYPEVFAGVLAAEDGQDTDTFQLYGQATDAAGVTAYVDFGEKTIASRATLDEAIPAEAETLILTFPDRTQGNGAVIGGLMLIQGADETVSEICLVSDFSVSGFTFKRGVLDTVPRAWPAGTPVWFIDDSMNFIDDVDIRAEGETVNYKILATTSQGTLAEDSAPVISEVMTARPHLPLRPADVEVNGDDGFAGPVDVTGLDPIPVTWARRNRETETSIIKAWTDGDVTPETGQTTIIEVLDPTGTTVITTHSGLSGTSFNLPASSFGGNTSGWIRVGSERDGHRELQAYAIKFIMPTVILSGQSLTVSMGTATVSIPGSPWTPTELTSTKFWLKADTLTGSNGDPIATWPNFIVGGNDATQATSGSRPTLDTTTALAGMNVVDFNGSNQFMDMPNIFSAWTAGSVVFVAKSTGNSAPFKMGTQSGANQNNHYPYIDGVTYDDFGSTTRMSTGAVISGGSLASWHIGSFHSASADWRQYFNGRTPPQYSTSTNTVGFRTNPLLGKQDRPGVESYFLGKIAEVCIFDTLLSDADRQKAEGYLAHKWGLTADLPSGHPYKTVPPTT